MMRMFHGTGASVPQTVHAQEAYSRQQAADGHTLRAAAVREPVSIAERVRTFVDRTLDAAFGRFDH